jgi:hypothetical protein
MLARPSSASHPLANASASTRPAPAPAPAPPRSLTPTARSLSFPRLLASFFWSGFNPGRSWLLFHHWPCPCCLSAGSRRGTCTLLPSNLRAHHNRLKHHGPRHCDMPHVQHPSLPSLAIHQLHPLVTCSWLATTTRLTLCNMLQLMLKL